MYSINVGVPYHVWTMVAAERLSTVQDFKTRWKDVGTIESEAPEKGGYSELVTQDLTESGASIREFG